MYCQCPKCGQVYHLRLVTVDDAEWIARVAPDTKPGEMPLVSCYQCRSYAELESFTAPFWERASQRWREAVVERQEDLTELFRWEDDGGPTGPFPRTGREELCRVLNSRSN